MALGYGSIIFAISIFSILLLIDASDIKYQSKLISTTITPTAQASTKMSNAVNSALASLRGWVLLEEEEQKNHRSDAWIAIRQAEIVMRRLSPQWINPENLSLFNKITPLLNEFEKFQTEVENLAHKPYNTAASNIFLIVAAPLANSMSLHITQMIELEKAQPTSNKRKELLLAMADVRGAHGHELANIRAYLLTADNKFKIQYESQQAIRKLAYYKLLTFKNILTPEQKSNLKEFSLLKNKFDPLPGRMISIRGKPDWDKAKYKLKTQASPTGNNILEFLSKMSANQNKELAIAGGAITEKTEEYVLKLIALSIIVTVLAIIVGFLISRNISTSLTRAVKISRKISSGDYSLDSISKEKKDTSETGELMQALRAMASDLSDKENELLDNQSKIIESNKLAAIGGMAANIAHEINSPLQSISIDTYKIRKNDKNDKNDKNTAQQNNIVSATKIDKSVEKITSIIEGLLKLSRNTSGDSKSNVRLCDVIDDVTELSEQRLKLSSIKLDVIFHNNQDTIVLCEHSCLSQVITNLLNNSYDAVIELEEKWISIEVTDLGSNIEITVTDSGQGIPLEIRDKIFQAMFTSKDIGKGTGIGLSISREILRKHNGELILDLESENTRFVITVPKQPSPLTN